MPIRERIIIEDDEYGRLLVAREPAPELTAWAGTGPGRGAWEDAREVAAECTPPRDA